MSPRPLAQGHRDLMAQHQDPGVLPPRLPPRQAQHRRGPGDNEEDQLQAHQPKIIARPPACKPATNRHARALTRSLLGAYAQVACVFGTHKTAARSGTLMRKHHALARRLLDRQHDYLRFTTDWRIPADNNGSERDIRITKLKQKISGCLRTFTGAGQFCAIRSYLSTAAKHGLPFFSALIMLTAGRPWMPASA